MPWRNGGGTTRQLWRSEDVRVSVADLVVDGWFSTFPGVDRTFVPESGGFELRVDGEAQTTAALQPVRFPGEAAVEVTGLTGVPIRALNVMTRRGRCRADVAVHPIDVPPPVEGALGVPLADHLVHIHLFPDPTVPLP